MENGRESRKFVEEIKRRKSVRWWSETIRKHVLLFVAEMK